jgi:RNA polymerase sigma-70 factor (ECF subfamily)
MRVFMESTPPVPSSVSMTDVTDPFAGVESHLALERLYREEGARMWRAVLLMTGRPDVADDAVAEAFAQALARGDAIRQPRAWVWKAAVRIAAGQMKELRKQGSEVPPERPADLPTPTVELLDLLRDLSPMQRAAVVLHYYAGYPLRDAAALTGSTAPAMAVHLRRARTKLRSMLEADDA